MEGTILGPYLVLRTLGQGGMGAVYSAEVLQSAPGIEKGAVVALKVVHPHLLQSPGYFQRFLREAEIGRSVRHQNVVQTFLADAVVQDGVQHNLLVMELVEGQTLRDFLSEIGRIPEELCRHIGREVAQGLAAVHAAGAVHRDLKPENILITPDHVVKIMDLGVAHIQDEAIRLSQAGAFVGSLEYAAPEQLGGRGVGPSSDLYALGVVLYELLCGQNPFRRGTSAGIIAAHLDAVPVRLLDRDVGVTPFLSELVQTLLAKKAEERIPSANDLCEILTAQEASTWWTSRESHVLAAEHARPRMRVSRTTQVFGRDSEIEVLRAAFASAREGHGNTVLLLGEAGIGKTRLLDAFVRELEGEDVHVLYGSYPPFGGTGGLSDAITDHLGHARLETALAKYLRQAPALAAPFAAAVQRLALPTGIAPLGQEATQAALVHLMRGLAEERPVVWIVDDLHFAESQSRHAVLAMARAVEDHAVLLVVTSRPGRENEELGHFTRLGTCRRLDVGRLSPRQVVEMLREALGSESLADRLGARIAYKTDGIPYFILEIVRSLEEAGQLSRHPDGSYVETSRIEAIEVPSAVRELLESRLRELAPETRALLDVAAIAGYEFDADLVGRVLERPRLPVLQELARLTRHSGIVRDAGNRYRFDHHQIHEVLVAGVPLPLRREYHALIAEAFEASHTEIDDEAATFLATHHLQGSRPEQGLRHVERALQWLDRTQRSEAFLDLVGRALEQTALRAPERRLDLCLQKAQMLDRLGRRAEGGEVLEEAEGLAQAIGTGEARLRVLLPLGAHLRVGGRVEEARGRLEEALGLARATGDRARERAALGALASVWLSQGRYDEARTFAEQGLACTRAAEDDADLPSALGTLGMVEYSVGRSEEARRLLEQALQMIVARSDPWGEAHVRGNLGLILNNTGQNTEARAHLLRAQEIARQIGDREGEAHVEGSLGTMADLAGATREALGHFQRALALQREVGNAAGEAGALGNLGNAHYALAHWDEALACYEQVVQSTREIGDLHLETLAHVARGQILGWLGAFEEADASFAEALACARTTRVPMHETYARFSLAAVDAMRGERERARTSLEQLQGAIQVEAYADLAVDICLEHARVLAAIGDDAAAAARFLDARQAAEAAGIPRGVVEAEVGRSLATGAGPSSARGTFEAHAGSLAPVTRVRIHFGLWQLGAGEEHLVAAHDALEALIDRAPSRYRKSARERVPLHRQVDEAWKARGAAPRA